MAKKIVEAKPKILVVDADEVARMLILKVLKHGGYDVTVVLDGKQALDTLAENPFDLMILDLEWLNIEWTELVRQSLALRKKISVIILTATGSLESAIQAIRFHISDYMLKPVVPREILDSVRNSLKDQAIVEIPSTSTAGKAKVRKGKKPIRVEIEQGLFYDRERRQVKLGTAIVSLTKTENKIFACLVDMPDRVVETSEIIDSALGYTVRDEDAGKMLRPVICRLKKKLVRLGLPKEKIQNVRGSGYLLERTVRQN